MQKAKKDAEFDEDKTDKDETVGAEKNPDDA